MLQEIISLLELCSITDYLKFNVSKGKYKLNFSINVFFKILISGGKNDNSTSGCMH